MSHVPLELQKCIYKIIARPDPRLTMIESATDRLFENFQIAGDMLAGREYFLDHFTAPDAHFFWCCRRATQLGVDISGFPNVAAHFKRIRGAPERQEAARLRERSE